MKVETRKFVAKTGNEAAAFAMKQINPDVVAAYPITPSSEIVMIFSKYVADGEVDTEFIPVESEHSAISVCIGASASGARVITATSSQGLALMHEILYIASSMRLPIVMIVGNRALSGPLNIHCDHSDTMGSRDCGWIQMYCENANEVYHTIINAVRISEEANLPCMVMMDGFIVTHGMEKVFVLEDEEVKSFIGKRKPLYSLLDVEKPITLGSLTLFDYYLEYKRNQLEGVIKAKKIINDVFEEYRARFGINVPSFVEEYNIEDAEIVVVVMSSAAGTFKEVVDELRNKGEKVGVLRLKVMRPFPYEILREKLTNVKVVGVMDRAETFSTMGGPLSIELRAALYPLSKRPLVQSFVFGLGGREFGIEDAMKVFDILKDIGMKNKITEEYIYIGLRE
ncbi:MAG: pyruvate ferredoxin oxidoreductase [Candidatus Hydrothermales bacterium]